MKQNVKAQSKAVKTAVKQSTNAVKTEKTAVKKSTNAVKKVDGITYLSTPLTGKQLMSKKSEQNKDAKLKLRTISSCITAILASEGTFLSSFVRFNPADITPKNLIPLRTESEKQFTDAKGFSTWVVLGLIKRFYESKK